MKLKKIVREDKSVQFIVEKANDDGHIENFDVTAHEAPHPEMDNALVNLAPVVQRIMEFKSVAGIAVHSVGVSYTKHGTRSVALGYTRSLNAIPDKTHKATTVSFRIDDPTDGEDGARECKKAESEAVEVAIAEGIRYASGERQQILLPLEDANKEPKGGENEPKGPDLFEEDPASTPDQPKTPEA